MFDMKKNKVLFLGSRPLGSYVYKILSQMDNVEIIGSVVRKPSENAWWKEDPYELSGGNIFTHADIQRIDFDFGVSINYWKLIEPEVIHKPSLGFINIHHSYLLSLRGRDMATHAILGARKNNRWYHGSTLHYIDDSLDSGPIIASESCPITEADTAWTLFNKTEILAKQILKKWLPRIVANRPPTATPEKLQPLNLRSEGAMQRIGDISFDPIQSYDVVRAYDFNGYYEPASTIIGNKQVFLTTNEAHGTRTLLKIDSGRSIYEMVPRNSLSKITPD